MPNQWAVAPSEQWSVLRENHDAVIGNGAEVRGLRRPIAESWRRSLALDLNPDAVLAATDLNDCDLRAYRNEHPLSLVLPTIHRLLIQHTFEASLIIAVGDQSGRLLWIDGDRTLRRKAEDMLFVEGADWSESRVGTSAPGTALALDHGIQIAGPEHFTRIVHPWSCTAVPVHDPFSGAVLGVIDVTGGDDAVAPATLPLMEAAVAAVEAELRVGVVKTGSGRLPRIHHAVAPPQPVLSVLGPDAGLLQVDGRELHLSTRHAEILALLATHPAGLSAERLADLVYERRPSLVTLRAEMVRLRRELDSVALAPLSRPYRLPRHVELDANRVLAFLDRGAHRVALAAYGGPVLPRSSAPGIVELRSDVRECMRAALLTDAAVDTLLDYARTDEAALDEEIWRACLRLLPAHSPRRASVVHRLERIAADLDD